VTHRELIGRTLTVLGLIGLGLVLMWFVTHVIGIIILLLMAAILAAGLEPFVAAIQRWRLPGNLTLSRGVAILVVYLALVILLGVILSVILIPAVNEGMYFTQHLPSILHDVRVWLVDVRRHMPWLPDLAAMLDRLPAELAKLTRYGARAAGVAFRFAGGLVSVITVVVFTYYMLLSGSETKAAFLSLFPDREHRRVSRILSGIGTKFGGWLRGQILLSSTVGAIVGVYLLIIGMPFPFLLGIVAGIGELIPMVGLTLGAVIAVLVALSQPAWRLIAVSVFYAVMMQIEPHVLAPRIMGRAVGMPPLLIIVALLVGVDLLGILGALLAVPVAAALAVIASEIVEDLHRHRDR
jgi:predicted PurR-regulated permease PerM